MQVRFWGTRGSLPAGLRGEHIEKKIRLALQAALRQGLKSEAQIDAFIAEELPFDVRGTYGCNTSCIEVRGDEGFVICDAGTGLRDLGNHIMSLGLQGPQEFHLFISHPHWDHIQGFPFFVPAFIPGNVIHVYGFHEGLEEIFSAQMRAPFFPLTLDALGAEVRFHHLDVDGTREIAGFEVSGCRQNHPGDSFGYRFDRGGRRVVYSTDSEHTEQAYEDDYPYVDFVRGADLLVFDAQYNLADHFHSKATWGHSSNMMGIELAVRAGVKRLCLFHNEHSVDDHGLAEFLSQSRRYLEIFDDTAELRVDLSYDGLVVDL